MAVSTPESAVRRAVLLHAVLLGVPLGVSALAAASLVLASSPRVLAAITGLAATAALAFGIGIWAGAPASRDEELPLSQRLIAAGLAVCVAGAVATVLSRFSMLLAAPAGRIGALFLLLALPTYALALALPVLLAWGERLESELDEEEQPEGWGSLGALAVGLLAGAVAGVLLAGLVLLPRVGPGAVLVGASLLPALARLLPQPQGSEVQEDTLFEAPTPFGSLRVAEVVYPGERQPERRLYLNDEQESGELVRSGAPALAYIVAAERWLAELAPGAGAYLFLGGGAYTLPRRIAERDPAARITVVELDPEVTRVAERFFGLRPQLGIRVVHGDARAFVSRAPAAAFDRIYVDVYGGQEALPYSLVTREAFQQMRGLLRPGGVVALNLIGTAAGPEGFRLWSVIRTFADVFPAVALYSHLGPDHPDRQNFLLAGAAEPDARLPQRAGLFEPWPQPEWPGWSGTLVFRDLFLSAPSPGPDGRDPGAESGAQQTQGAGIQK